ncbi:thioredoxin [Aurantibacter crassamenti]|uniref:thioredoxin n=1 Tax=Aurantibacter crassamenti TaxID=1837375 RepID=UPI00193A9921|nr:thioredoxin [Aurantibacter crassamenti]MBM1106583.1 thioredoxin [Aurantibacter crassamenti]
MKGNFDKVIASEIPVLVDFFAEWCGPCKTLGPILKDVKSELGDAVRIVKIDVDKNELLASKYQVKGVPTMLLFKNGKQLWRKSGALPKQEIMGVIKENS